MTYSVSDLFIDFSLLWILLGLVTMMWELGKDGNFSQEVRNSYNIGVGVEILFIVIACLGAFPIIIVYELLTKRR